MASPEWDYEARVRALRSDGDASRSAAFAGDELESCSNANSYHVDKKQAEDMVDEAIGASVVGQLQHISASQRELGAVADRIWALLVQLEQKLDECRPVRKSPSMDSIDHAADAMVRQAKLSAKRHVDNAVHGTVSDDLSLSPSAACKHDTACESNASTAKGSVISLDMYDLEKLSTDQLFATSGLASSASFLNPSARMFRGLGTVTRFPPRSSSPKRSLAKVTPAPAPPPDPAVSPASSGPPCSDDKDEDRPSSKGSAGPADRKRSCHSSMDALRVEQDSRLVAFEDQAPGTETGVLRHIPQLSLRIFGVVLFSEGRAARWYRSGVLVLAAAIFGHCLVTAVRETDCLHLHVSTACYALGGFLGSASLWVQRLHFLVGPAQKPLVSYAQRQNFFDEWQRLSLRRFAVICALWFLIVATRFLSTTEVACETSYCVWPWSSGSFIFVTGLLAALAYCQVYVCCGLELAIDTFCCCLHEDLDVDRGIAAWSMLQAVLRRSAQTVDTCFLSMNTTVLATLLLTGIEVLRGKRPVMDPTQPDGTFAYDNICWCLSVLSQMALLLYTVFQAAAVTEKCSRVPALVNSWMFAESQRDEARQYIVQHIASSNAGFYVKGVRLTALMALKLAYVFGIIAFTLVSDSIIV